MIRMGEAAGIPPYRCRGCWAPGSPPAGVSADVRPDHWFTPHVEACYAYTPGLQCGTNVGTGKMLFCPNSQVSRAYMAELLASAFHLGQ